MGTGSFSTKGACHACAVNLTLTEEVVAVAAWPWPRSWLYATRASEFKASSSAASFEFGASQQFKFEIESFKLHLIDSTTYISFKLCT